MAITPSWKCMWAIFDGFIQNKVQYFFCRYAVGGYDGSEMVPSMEVYDPRLGSWIIGEPMNQSRGYSAAAVFKEAIYVIGGVKAGVDVVDIVCCFYDPLLQGFV